MNSQFQSMVLFYLRLGLNQIWDKNEKSLNLIE